MVYKRIYGEITFGVLKGAFMWPYIDFFIIFVYSNGQKLHGPWLTSRSDHIFWLGCLPFNNGIWLLGVAVKSLLGLWEESLLIFIDFYQFCCIPMCRNCIVQVIHPDVTKFFCEQTHGLTVAYNQIKWWNHFCAVKGFFAHTFGLCCNGQEPEIQSHLSDYFINYHS